MELTGPGLRGLVKLTAAVILMVTSVITAMYATLRAKRRMRKTLGRTVSNGDLASINTWMKVMEAEHSGDQNPSPRP